MRRRTMKDTGVKIVLTADRTLMSSYNILFDGMVAASQTNTIPSSVLKGLLAPSVKTFGDKRVVTAPLGLRRVEASLIRGGFVKEEVGIFRPKDLTSVIGPATQIVAISSGDPSGLGMNSSTMEALYGGKIYNKIFFKQILDLLSKLKNRGYKFKVVLGGPGAWQLLDTKESIIDHIITGYCEENAVQLFRNIIEGKADRVLKGVNIAPEKVPAIIGASSMGVVEISRGCGLGCDYCTIKNIPMTHMPADLVLSDIQTNISFGIDNAALISEDFFRYGSKSLKELNPGALIGLLSKVREKTKVKLIQTDHVNLASAGAYSDAELKEVSRLIKGREKRRYIWLNLGVETPSERLLKLNSPGKAVLRGRNNWEEFALEQIVRLGSFDYFPLVSVIMGLPGETEEDVLGLERFVDKLKDKKVSVFPLYFTAIENKIPAELNAGFRKIYGRIMRKSYALNLKLVPKMYWENQRIAGVNRARMLLLQCLGRGQRFIMKY